MDKLKKSMLAKNSFEVKDFLDIVEVENSQLDIILVDNLNRFPMGRPTLTIAVDKFSKLIYGYYLNVNAPSGNSVRMCLLNGIMFNKSILILLKYFLLTFQKTLSS